MERFEEFSQAGKNFIYINFSGLATNDEFLAVIDAVKNAISKYPEKSLYTITNIENIRFDSNSKAIVAKYLEENKPYVKYGVVIGLDGIKKMLIQTVMKLSGRKNLFFAFTKEKAIELLIQLE